MTSGVLPIEEPQATPVCPLAMTGSPVRPASAIASSAARTASCDTRPMLRNCLRAQCAGGANSTGPARRVLMSV
jgi:hypothetical protein